MTTDIQASLSDAPLATPVLEMRGITKNDFMVCLPYGMSISPFIRERFMPSWGRTARAKAH